MRGLYLIRFHTFSQTPISKEVNNLQEDTFYGLASAGPDILVVLGFITLLYLLKESVRGTIVWYRARENVPDVDLKTGVQTLEHVDSCAECHRKRPASDTWGHTHITMDAYHRNVTSRPDLKSRIFKYRACLACGTCKRRGRSPRSAQGQLEEAQVADSNIAALTSYSYAKRWFQ